MPFSLSTGFFYDRTPEATVDEFAAAGYTHCEFGLEHGILLLDRGGDAHKLGEQLRAYAEAKGLCFPQGHLDLNLDLCRDVDAFKTWLDRLLLSRPTTTDTKPPLSMPTVPPTFPMKHS